MMPSGMGLGAQAQAAAPPGYAFNALGGPALGGAPFGGAPQPVPGMKMSMKEMAMRGQTASNTPAQEETFSTFSFVKDQMKQAQ
jgi:hypothetical protein